MASKFYRFYRDNPILYGNLILQNFISNYDIIRNQGLTFAEYAIKDEDTPESLALKLYGSSSLAWVILWLNDIVDPFYGWPLTTSELEKYINNKYGDNKNSVHHYELDGKIVNSNVPGAKAVSNYTYETDINNNKRNIYLIEPSMMGALL